MARFHVGAVLDRTPSPRYFEGGSTHLELALVGTPRAATARKLRAQLPSGATFAVQIPSSFVRGPKGALRHDDDRPQTELIQALAAFAPTFIVLSTGVELTPGPRDREALASFAEALRAAGAAPLVWQAGGLWEADEAAELCRKLGILPAVDPLAPIPHEGPVAYAKVRAIGVHMRLGDGTMARIAEGLLGLGAEDTYIALDAVEGPRRAWRLAQILAGSADLVPTDDGEDEAIDGEDEDLDDDE